MMTAQEFADRWSEALRVNEGEQTRDELKRRIEDLERQRDTLNAEMKSRRLAQVTLAKERDALRAAIEGVAADLEEYAEEIAGTDEEGLARSTADKLRQTLRGGLCGPS
jgi:chromosome segregation ATPase